LRNEFKLKYTHTEQEFNDLPYVGVVIYVNKKHIGYVKINIIFARLFFLKVKFTLNKCKFN